MVLLLGVLTGTARAQVAPWRVPTSEPSPSATPVVRLGHPEPLGPNAPAASPTDQSPPAATEVPFWPQPIIRCQSADPVPPSPPPPGAPAAPPFPGAAPGGEEPYNCGVVAGNTGPSAPAGGFFSKCWDNCKEWFGKVPKSLEEAFEPGAGHGLFQSDHKFDSFTSPVTNPFLFEDPRALTEVRPIFMWQEAPRANPVFHGGDMFFFGAQARVAITDWLSLVVNRFGGVWMEPNQPDAFFQSHAGFSEIWLGPKITFYRNDTTNTVMAGGLTFQIPTGPAKVFQDTGSLGLVPYLSFAQNFLRSFEYGSFNFLNTTGYDFSTSDVRSPFFFTSFHLDFDVGNAHRIYPLIELNWFHYTQNGHNVPAGFEGGDLFNFGGQAAGRNDLSIAIGARYKINDFIQTGLAVQWGLVDHSHNVDGFRLTFDMIFRY
jgi:hypothetical protein